MNLGISEIIEKVSKLKTDAEKIKELRANTTPALKTILQGAFDPRIIWLLPDGNPPYKPNDLVDQEGSLYTEHRKLYLFIQGGNINLTQTRRETLFIEMLEIVAPDDAKLLLAIKDKTLPFVGLTKEIVQQAYPGLFG
jgi:hypothetical protein